MSTNPVPPAMPPPAPLVPAQHKKSWLSLMGGGGRDDEIVVFSHSSLFFWWPVWLLGFVCAGYTYFNGMTLGIVPSGTEAAHERIVDTVGAGKQADFLKRDVLILPAGKSLTNAKNLEGEEKIVHPFIHMTGHRAVGTIYLITLLCVITLTNISVRGLWSVFLIVFVIMLTFILMAGGWWGIIFRGLGQLAIYMNMGGYLLISIVLFALWLVNYFFFDRQTYMVFRPGQVRVRLMIGGEETAYDTAGIVVQKQRNDLFRHWVLGFGSGDLIIRPVGQAYALDLPNVLSVGRVVREVEKLIKEKMVVESTTLP